MNLKTYYMDKSINYQESLCEDEMIQKYYLIRNPEHVSYVTIPDGCVDIQFMFQKNKKTACISGSPVTPRTSLYTDQDWIFGIKLNPGVLPVAMSQDAIGIPECYIDITRQEGIVDILCELEKLDSDSGNSGSEKLARASGSNVFAKNADATLNISVSPDMPVSQDIHISADMPVSQIYIYHRICPHYRI